MYKENLIKLSSLWNFLFLLLIPALLFNLEINFSGISASGDERIGHSASLDGDILVSNQSQQIGIKFFDILSLFMLSIFYFLIKSNGYKIKIPYKKPLLSYLFFTLICLISILVNYNLYTSSQLIVCILYFLKLIQISFLFFFIKIYFEYGGTGSQILNVVTISVFFGGLLGISDTLIQSIFNVRLFSSIIPDRVQYYGIILLMLAYMSIQLTNISPENFSNKRKILLIISFIVGVISVFMCGKRTILLALIFLMLYAISKFKMTISAKFLVFTIFFLGALTLPLVVNFETTFQRDSESLSAGLSEDYAYEIDNSALGNVEVSGLDYSLTERLAKWVKSAGLIRQSPIIGTGYWGSPYAHNFLPDNGIFQVAVEMGLLGLFSLLFFLYVSSKTPLKKSKRDIYNSRRIILPIILIVISLTANPFYIFNLMAVYLILIFGWIERFNNKIRL
tara:strand:+ start:92 stop:1441 length:1350 start_codon:yes stop_codon:yes gene_type:complete